MPTVVTSSYPIRVSLVHTGEPSVEGKNAIIQKLIDLGVAVQEHATGTVTLQLVDRPDVTIDLQIHEWE